MGSNLSPEERARLIQKGRRLLEKARGSPPKPTAPPRPLPNLLSRPTASSPQNGDDKNSSKAKTTTKEEDTEGWDFDDF